MVLKTKAATKSTLRKRIEQFSPLIQKEQAIVETFLDQAELDITYTAKIWTFEAVPTCQWRICDPEEVAQILFPLDLLKSEVPEYELLFERFLIEIRWRIFKKEHNLQIFTEFQVHLEEGGTVVLIALGRLSPLSCFMPKREEIANTFIFVPDLEKPYTTLARTVGTYTALASEISFLICQYSHDLARRYELHEALSIDAYTIIQHQLEVRGIEGLANTIVRQFCGAKCRIKRRRRKKRGKKKILVHQG